MKVRMIMYFAACAVLGFGVPAWRLGMGSVMRPWYVTASCLAAIVFWWAALREMQRVRTDSASNSK